MLQFKAKNLDAVQKQIDEIDKVLDSFEPFYRKSATRILKNVFIKLFQEEGATSRTQKWHQLSETTLQSRRRRGNTRRKILHDTGRLRRSYVNNPVISIHNNEMKIGSNVPYARFHETGTRYMPARPVVGFAQIVARDRLQRSLRRYLKKRLENGTT